jgi:hypothetical protein
MAEAAGTCKICTNRGQQHTSPLCTSGFPNFFQSLGPNAGLGNGNLLIIIEQIAKYVGQCLQKLATHSIRALEPKQKCVDNFTSYCEAYFKRTVFNAECGSWYKSSPPGTNAEERKRERVTALWLGSSLHAVKALEKVRFEDFEMEYVEENEFAWFGDGWTVTERTVDMEGLTWYLNNTKFTHEDLKGQEKDVNGEKKEMENITRDARWLSPLLIRGSSIGNFFPCYFWSRDGLTRIRTREYVDW